MTKTRKRQIAIGVFIGLIAAVLYWTYNKVDTVNKGLERFEDKQAELDQKFIDLNVKHCGKSTFCSDDDIMQFEFFKFYRDQ